MAQFYVEPPLIRLPAPSPRKNGEKDEAAKLTPPSPTLHLMSGPSRSGDIEQKLILGAHGPRALHVTVVGG
jgi:L-lactate utilization protein LutC